MNDKRVYLNGKEVNPVWAETIAAVFSSSPRVESHRTICETLKKVLPKVSEKMGLKDDSVVEIVWGDYKQTSTIGALKLGVEFGISITTFKAGKKAVANLEDSLLAAV